jgi:hypothetical protein
VLDGATRMRNSRAAAALKRQHEEACASVASSSSCLSTLCIHACSLRTSRCDVALAHRVCWCVVCVCVWSDPI